MGFVVNKRRFKQSGTTFLLPYSNKSKVVTYLTPDNFKGSSSTIWGDEYTSPMTKSTGNWELTSNGTAVRIYNSTNSSVESQIIIGSGDRGSFTFYIVAQYEGDFKRISIRGDISTAKWARILLDSSSSSIKQTGSTFREWESTNYNYITTDTTLYEAYQVYGVSHPIGAKPAHVLNDKSIHYFSSNGSVKPWYFLVGNDSSWNPSAIYIKFLAIVSEAESDTVLQNNINYIRNQLNLT